jgi:predicted DNA-binding transcriptional regulator YafY
MGLPLVATPGPHGGYGLVPGRRTLPLALTADEAIGMILSYKAFLRYAESPFAAQSVSAITKLRAVLPPDVVGELDRVAGHVVVLEPTRDYRAPLLADLLAAALDGAHLRIVYDSRSGVSERVIYPHGLFAAQGYWYCACFDYRRGMNVSLRVDRFHAAERVTGYDAPARVPVRDWLDVVERGETPGLRLCARVTARGMKSLDLASLFGQVAVDESGAGLIDASIPESEVDYFARRLLPLGTDVVVESPPQLTAALQRLAEGVASLYRDGAADQPSGEQGAREDGR